MFACGLTKRIRPSAASVTAGLCLLLGGCGGSDDDSPKPCS